MAETWNISPHWGPPESGGSSEAPKKCRVGSGYLGGESEICFLFFSGEEIPNDVIQERLFLGTGQRPFCQPDLGLTYTEAYSIFRRLFIWSRGFIQVLLPPGFVSSLLTLSEPQYLTSRTAVITTIPPVRDGITPSQNSDVAVVTPSTLECDLFGRQGLYRGDQVTVKSLGWVLHLYDWCPYKKEKF